MRNSEQRERLAEAGIEPSRPLQGPGHSSTPPLRSYEAAEFLLEQIGNMPPAEAEPNYYAELDQPAMAA